MPVNQTPEVLKAARLLGPALGRKASDPGTLRLAAAVLNAEPAKGAAPPASPIDPSADVSRLRIHRPTNGTAWWNAPELQPDAAESRRRAAAIANGYTEAEYDAASVKERRRMGAPRDPWPEPESIAEL